MDRHIKENLEEYMRGSMEPAKLAEFDKRLGASDEETKREVRLFQQQGEMIRSAFQVAADVGPSSGFYARVMDRIQTQRSRSMWFAFLDPQFSRRLAFASLALLVLLGLTMFSAPDNEEAMLAEAPAYYAVDEMAEQAPTPVLGENQQEDRDTVLVNLATYQE